MKLRAALIMIVFLATGLAIAQSAPAPPTMEAPPPSKHSKPSKPSGKHKQHSAELSWKASATKGVDGYFVYRAEVKPSAVFERITPKLLKKTRYKDTKVEAGKTYAYAVTAVQKSGKTLIESDRTPPVAVQIPSP